VPRSVAHSVDNSFIMPTHYQSKSQMNEISQPILSPKPLGEPLDLDSFASLNPLAYTWRSKLHSGELYWEADEDTAKCDMISSW